MLKRYTFSGADGAQVTVETAAGEDDARRLAMIERWGRGADAVTPHAPEYKGRGLSLISAKQVKA